MRIKSYFAAKIQSAMRQARDEFGDDVMLLNSRVTAPELSHLGEYEVVVALNHSQPELSTPLDMNSNGFVRMLHDQDSPARLTRRADHDATIKEIEASLSQIGLQPQMAKALTAVIQDLVAKETMCGVQKVSSPPPLAMQISTPKYATPISSQEPQDRRLRSEWRPAPRAPAVSGLAKFMAATGLCRMIQRSGT